MRDVTTRAARLLIATTMAFAADACGAHHARARWRGDDDDRLHHEPRGTAGRAARRRYRDRRPGLARPLSANRNRQPVGSREAPRRAVVRSVNTGTGSRPARLRADYAITPPTRVKSTD